MINENHALLLEVWATLKSHIDPKERLEVADQLMSVFDEFGLIEESLLEEDLDKELRAAARSRLVFDEEEEDEDDDYSY